MNAKNDGTTEAPEPGPTSEKTVPAKRKRGRGADPEQTRAALIDAALNGLVEDGYGATTARSIGARANCNQAAIYYHFGGIEPLLIEALRISSKKRLVRYQEALPDATGLQDVILMIEKLYVEDRESGHLSLLTELVGAITASPGLREGIAEATEPWLGFMQERIAEVVKPLPFGAGLPTRDIADLIFSLVVGVEMRNKVDQSDDRSDRLFRMARLAAALVESTTKDS